MAIEQIIKSQYQAALSMLEQAITKCPEDLWTSSAYQNRYWHVAYHGLFYTHLYLQPTEADFQPWAKHREESQFMGPLPWPPHRGPNIGTPYTQEEVLAYLAFCRQEVNTQVDGLDWDGPSGFDWLPMNKLELQLYTIRHLQQHTGELSERLGALGIEIHWVGMQPQ